MQYLAKDKYYSMERSYERLKKINTNNGNVISNADARDATEDFFNQCYHFKDWLKKDTSVVLKKDVEAFISGNEALSLAADYCNSFKHAGLDKRSRSGQELEKMNTHVNFELTPNGFVASSRLELTISGQKYDAFKLATNCVIAWNRFLSENEVIFPAP